jgi:hypothetical protein
MFTEGFVFSDLSPLTSKIDISNVEYKGGDSETKLGTPAFSNTGPVFAATQPSQTPDRCCTTAVVQTFLLLMMMMRLFFM